MAKEKPEKDAVSSEEVTEEALKKEIKMYHRDEVLHLLKMNVLTKVEAEDKTEVYRSITALRALPLMEYIAEDAGKIPESALELDFSNFHNREFVAEVLKKYRKNLDLSDTAARTAYFDLGCRVNDADFVKYFLKQKDKPENYLSLAKMNAETFAQIAAVRPDVIADHKAVELYDAIARSDGGQDKIAALLDAGFDLNAKDTDGNTLRAAVEKRVKTGRYPQTRDGNAARQRDKQVLSLLTPKEANEEKGKDPKQKRTRIIVGICIAAIAVICIIIAVVMARRDSGTDSTDSTASSTAAESAATSEAASAQQTTYLDTDTDQTVADGDTVNIDYTGYSDGVAFDGGSTNGAGADLTIGSGTYIDDFEEQLIGHKVGEEVDVNVTFPDDYGATDLAGKDATFEVTINGIYRTSSSSDAES